jgi:outer membrane protein
MIRTLVAALLAAAPLAAAAESLTQVYQDALRYDAQYAAAQQALRAGRERVPQGRALLLPSLNLTANVTRSSTESESDNPLLQPSFERDIDSHGYALTFTQPIYRRQNWLQADQAELQSQQAEFQYGQAGQDLILRVAQAYFEVLAAQDTLALVRAQKVAIAEQLAQAKRNFEVGTATITDTHEAQARYDLSVAQEISAQNDLEARARALQQLTGKEYAELKPLRPDVQLAPPQPNDMQSWVGLAEKQSYPVLIGQALAEIARLEAQRNSAGHHPTLDLVASHNYTDQSASQLSIVGSNVTTNSVSLQLAVPLYQGGAISSREREAAYVLERTRHELENARRSSALTTRQAYLAVINGIAQVSALEQALVSSQSALQSNRLGYEVGVRINIDVLNAQQQVFSTRRDLALARYNTITNLLRLKAAAGSLREEDIAEVNRALAP